MFQNAETVSSCEGKEEFLLNCFPVSLMILPGKCRARATSRAEGSSPWEGGACGIFERSGEWSGSRAWAGSGPCSFLWKQMTESWPLMNSFCRILQIWSDPLPIPLCLWVVPQDKTGTQSPSTKEDQRIPFWRRKVRGFLWEAMAVVKLSFDGGCTKLSVSMSTEAVASSRTRIFVFCSKAWARQSSCLPNTVKNTFEKGKSGTWR